MTIAEIDPLYVKVFVPVRHYRELQAGTNAEVMPEEPIGGLHRAKVTVVIVFSIRQAALSGCGLSFLIPITLCQLECAAVSVFLLRGADNNRISFATASGRFSLPAALSIGPTRRTIDLLGGN
jgi:hypothetical protein